MSLKDLNIQVHGCRFAVNFECLACLRWKVQPPVLVHLRRGACLVWHTNRFIVVPISLCVVYGMVLSHHKL